MIGETAAGAAEGADRDRTVQPERIAHGYDGFPQIQPAGIVAANGRQIRRRIADLQQGDIVHRIVRDDLRPVIFTAVQSDHDPGGAVHHMRIGHDQSGRIDDAAAAERIAGGAFLGTQEFVEQLLQDAEIAGIVQVFIVQHFFRADIDHRGQRFFDRPDHLVAAAGLPDFQQTARPLRFSGGPVMIQDGGKYQNNCKTNQKKT